MKNRFYRSENILEKATSLKTEAEKYCPENNIHFIPEKAALLVIDMQNIFLEEKYSPFIPSSSAILPRIKQLAKKFDESKRPVIFTRHVNTEKNAGMMGKWWKSYIMEDFEASEITNKIDISESIVVIKPQYDAFIESDLEAVLRDKKITQLVICGVMTHLCCETTARSAFMKRFEVFFAVDGTATYNEQLHRGAIINLAHGFAKPVLINDIISDMDNCDAKK